MVEIVDDGGHGVAQEHNEVSITQRNKYSVAEERVSDGDTKDRKMRNLVEILFEFCPKGWYSYKTIKNGRYVLQPKLHETSNRKIKASGAKVSTTQNTSDSF